MGSTNVPTHFLFIVTVHLNLTSIVVNVSTTGSPQMEKWLAFMKRFQSAYLVNWKHPGAPKRLITNFKFVI